MSWLGDKFSWSNILSGGITGINDDALKAFGMGNNSTLGAVNDALKHGPLETSLEQGRPASIGALTKDRNERLGQDSTGSARTIGDLAALVGMAFGGLGGLGAAGMGAGATGLTAGTSAAGLGTGALTAGTTAAAGMGGGAGLALGAGEGLALGAAPTALAGMGGGTGITATALGEPASAGLLGTMTQFADKVKPYGDAAKTAMDVKGLLSPQEQAVQGHAPPGINPQGAQTLSQLYQQSGAQMTPEEQARLKRRSMWG